MMPSNRPSTDLALALLSALFFLAAGPIACDGSPPTDSTDDTASADSRDLDAGHSEAGPSDTEETGVDTQDAADDGGAATDLSTSDVAVDLGDLGGSDASSDQLVYETTYKNMALAGWSGEVGDIALVAGSHDKNFPYWGDRPWDNGLLLVGDRGYHFTHRRQGEALALDIDIEREESQGEIRYSGTMKRADDGSSVEVELTIPVDVARYPAKELGKPYDFLPDKLASEFVGMRWQPFELQANGDGTLKIEGRPERAVKFVHGEMEYGELKNIALRRFAFSYDYVNLAHAGEKTGYAFVDFKGHALDGSGKLGKLMDRYLTEFSSATVTLDDGLYEENKFGVDRPSQDEESVVMFENAVDLKHARLRRQMIQTSDSNGKVLYGLREIFEAKEAE